MKHGSFFTGIGGFDLAAQWMGWENVFQVEIDKWCRKVLEKNFPNVKRHEDIKEFNGKEYLGAVDIISGGFPCQPFSHAGKRKGTADNRYLWPEMFRGICEVRPTYVVGENVAGLVSMENGKTLDRILLDLESEGYTTEQFIIPACGVGAWHRRARIWIIAYTNSSRNSQSELQQPNLSSGSVRDNKQIIAYTFNSTDRTNGKQSRKTKSVSCEHRSTGLPRESCGTGSEIFANSKRNGYKNRYKKARAEERQGEQRGMCQSKRAGTQNVPNSDNQGLQGGKETRDACEGREKRNEQFTGFGKLLGKDGERERSNRCAESRLGGMVNGVSYWMDEPDGIPRIATGIKDRISRLKGLGNAIVPQVAYQIFKAIEQYNNER